MLKIRTFFSAPEYSMITNDGSLFDKGELTHIHGLVSDDDSHENETFYLVTTYEDSFFKFVKEGDDSDLGITVPSFRSVAYYRHINDAAMCVLENHCDIHEGCYPFASIDEYCGNTLIERKWFLWFEGMYLAVEEIPFTEGFALFGKKPPFVPIGYIDEWIDEGIYPVPSKREICDMDGNRTSLTDSDLIYSYSIQ
ncbi:hypothetical protein VCHA53O466_40179 [Vibrio chagasii]|nr:hypothetical protein VCHA53O466_40179 [Vibrio chagasii]